MVDPTTKGFLLEKGIDRFDYNNPNSPHYIRQYAGQATNQDFANENKKAMGRSRTTFGE